MSDDLTDLEARLAASAGHLIEALIEIADLRRPDLAEHRHRLLAEAGYRTSLVVNTVADHTESVTACTVDEAGNPLAVLAVLVRAAPDRVTVQ